MVVLAKGSEIVEVLGPDTCDQSDVPVVAILPVNEVEVTLQANIWGVPALAPVGVNEMVTLIASVATSQPVCTEPLTALLNNTV